MKHNFLLILLLILFGIQANGQKNYILDYDKLTDHYTYSEVVYNNGQPQEKKIKHLRLKGGDKVTCRMRNVNTFIYAPDIRSTVDSADTKTGSSSSSFNFLSALPSIIGQFSGLGALSIPLDYATQTRGAVSIQNLIYSLDQKLSQATDYSKLINIVGSEGMSLEEIRTQAAPLLSKLQNAEVVELNDLDSMLNDGSNILGSYYEDDREDVDVKWAAIVNRYNTLKTASMYESNIFADKLDLLQLSGLLRNSSFTYEEEFFVDDDATGFFDIDLVLYGKSKEESSMPSSTMNLQNDILQYYHEGLYQDVDGNIVEEPCAGCTPLLKAEGRYNHAIGSPPLSYEAIFDAYSEYYGAYGDWKIYDINGALVSRFNLGDKEESTAVVDEKGAAIAAGKVRRFKRKIHIPLAGATRIAWSTGLFFSSPFNARETFKTKFNADVDSMQFLSKELKGLTPSIGTQLMFELVTAGAIVPHLSLGASVNLMSQDNPINVLLGGGFRFKKLKAVSFSGGVSFCMVKRLDPYYDKNIMYSLDEIDSFDSSDYLKSRFEPGYFFGISIQMPTGRRSE